MYTKYQPDQLFTGTEMLSAGAVLICNEDGLVQEIVKPEEAGDNVQQLTGILSPGFINAHCHIELSHLKGVIAKHTGLVNFVQQVMAQRNQFELEVIEEAMQEAAAKLYESGTVAVADICNTETSIPLKKDSPLYWHNFIEVAGFVDAAAQNRFNEGRVLQEGFLKNNLNACITPHAPYSVSKTLFKLIDSISPKQLISIHNQETADENALYREKSGKFLDLYNNIGIDISSFEPTKKSSLQSWLPYFSKEHSFISVHNSFINREDIEYAQQRDIYYCICINANLYIENVVPPIDQLIEHGSRLLIGTDSLASNDEMHMMAEIKMIRKHFPHIPLSSILQWATLNGAEALGIQDQFGSFEQGKQPGLVLIQRDTAQRIS